MGGVGKVGGGEEEVVSVLCVCGSVLVSACDLLNVRS